ncbi:hypothetical protein KFE25_013948 [Diacronema lutheri]|uniref:Uncharacterized protein n=1 Tax=Diacronema lutheri TaxID=2081491 RepID=A0A8J5XK38_DIALT|nr:hypothetical protein KFE25_013948 [Diacronema lutheri]
MAMATGERDGLARRLRDPARAETIANAVGGSAARLALNLKRQQSASSVASAAELHSAGPSPRDVGPTPTAVATLRGPRVSSAQAHGAPPAARDPSVSTAARACAPRPRAGVAPAARSAAPMGEAADDSAAGPSALLGAALGACDEVETVIEEQSLGYMRMSERSARFAHRVDAVSSGGVQLAESLRQVEAALLDELRTAFYAPANEFDETGDDTRARAPRAPVELQVDALAERSSAVQRGLQALEDAMARAQQRSERLGAEVARALAGSVDERTLGASTELDTAHEADGAIARALARCRPAASAQLSAARAAELSAGVDAALGPRVESPQSAGRVAAAAARGLCTSSCGSDGIHTIGAAKRPGRALLMGTSGALVPHRPLRPQQAAPAPGASGFMRAGSGARRSSGTSAQSAARSAEAALALGLARGGCVSRDSDAPAAAPAPRAARQHEQQMDARRAASASLAASSR